jgi:hypothetical protein
MDRIPERDWKRLRAMQKEKLAMACEEILGKAEEIVRGRTGREHESYLKLYAHIRDADDDIALMFNDVRRSNVIERLVAWKAHGLVGDQELQQFSPETQECIRRIENIGR